jgi:hypothetical protein
LAPAKAYGLCDWAALIGSTAKAEQAVVAFNENIMQDIAPIPTSAAPVPQPTASAKPDYKIEAKVSKKTAVYNGDMDLRWWFDNRMRNDDASDGASCGLDWVSMGDNVMIKFSCSFADESVEKLLREAMNTMIQESVTSSSISAAEKPFSRYMAVPGNCNSWGVCPTKKKPFTSFPIEGDLRLFSHVDRNEEQGWMHYEISEGGSDACRMCSYLGAAGAAAGGLANTVQATLAGSSVGGPIGVFTGSVTIGCLMAC